MTLKPGQVKKPLILAVVLGTISGLFMSTDGNSPISDVSWSIFIGYLLFPALLSLFTARNYFFWGFVSAAIGGVLSEIINAVMTSTQLHVAFEMRMFFFVTGLPFIAFFVVAGVLLSSGPVSLVRYIIQRRRDLANISEAVAPAESATKEGAWPPPPKNS